MNDRSDRLDWRLFAAACTVAAAILILRSFMTGGSVPLLNDTDDAMRLVQVRDLLAGQSWHDAVQHRLNVPFGAMIHWSRLIDAAVGALIILFSPLGTANAEIAAIYVWPLLLLGAMLAASAAIAVRLAGREAMLPGFVLPALSMIALTEFVPGRIDHHSVQIVLTLLMAWFAIGAVERHRRAIGAGIAAATALAIGAESLPAVVATVVAFGIGWVVDPRLARAMRWFGLSLALAMLVHFLIAIPPDRWFVPYCDAISIVYLVASIAGGLGVVALSWLPARSWSPWLRLASGCVLGGMLLAVLFLAFPDCLRGPYANLDPWLLEHWISKIDEAKPLWVSMADSTPFLVAAILPVVLALGVAVWSVLRDAGRRDMWLIYLGFVALTALVMLLQVRGVRLATPLALPAVAALVAVLRARYVAQPRLAPALGLVATWLAAAGLFVALAVSLVFPVPAQETASAASGSIARCRMPESFSALSKLPPARIMAPVDLGAHLLAFTPHGVVGAPYHRNVDGIADTFAFFSASEAKAREIARARGITLVVICPGMPELRGLPDAAPDALAPALAAGTPPAWLHPIDAPGPLRIYEIATP